MFAHQVLLAIPAIPGQLDRLDLRLAFLMVITLGNTHFRVKLASLDQRDIQAIPDQVM